MQFYTIGVYNTTEKDFFHKLTANKVDTFLDIRQRRGVRGSQYAFANSNRLQHKLALLKINYQHLLELAPSEKIRHIQEDADAQEHVQRRKREQLNPDFITTYKKNVLDLFDFTRFLNTLQETKAKRIVFFCVEELPEACHRSLVTDKLSSMGYKIIHL